MKFNELGRSMVEMLGVLAIIGVLSVGAIAGYSKAMMKYKLNKQTEQVNTLISNMIIYKNDFRYQNGDITQLVPYYKKLNIIPEEMIKGDGDYIYDVFNTRVNVVYNNQTPNVPGAKPNDFTTLSFLLPESSVNSQICYNIVTAAKEFHQDLYLIETYVGASASYTGMHYGDSYCKQQNDPCIKDLSITDMEQLCNVCQDKIPCTLSVLVK